MIKKVAFFVIGFLLGIAFGMVPQVIETMANTNICRESCPASLRGISIVLFLIMPFAWGIILVKTIGKPHSKRILFAFAIFSLAIMMLLTWFLYKYQHP